MRTTRLWTAASLMAGLAACGAEDRVSTLNPDAVANGLAERAAASNPTPAAITLVKIGEIVDGRLSAAEIPAYDDVSRRLFVVNGAIGSVDVIDLRDPAAPVKLTTLTFAGPANGVATSKGVVAIAVEAPVKTDPGAVVFYRATTLERISEVTVGALPDMVTFTPDGRTVLVANEGEPDATYTVDPEGSISIIDVTNVNRPSVRTASFVPFNGQRDALIAKGVRLFGPRPSTVAQDLEPEYITVDDAGTTAWVTLQEANAVAVVDIAGATVRDIVPLGYKDHSLPRNAFDPSDRDNPATSNGQPGVPRIGTWPVLGMYQPDGIASYTVNGQTYLVTANEGDARDYPDAGYTEEARVRDLALEGTLDRGVFGPICGACTANQGFQRLTVTRATGRNPATGLYDRLYAFGARSFSIWTTAGQLVWDSGSELEVLTRDLANTPGNAFNFNASNTNNTTDDRSDNKGPEPEDVVIAHLGRKVFAFVGLERVGGVVAYDITNPFAPTFAAYLNTRNGTAGDRGPEGIAFIPANRSPNRQPLLVVGHETSGSTAIYQVNLR